MLIGHEGDNSLAISTGNAAEALGLPIVTGTPLAEEQGEEMTEGVLIVNPAGSRGTINYNVNGNHYVAEPGMKQKLPPRANRPRVDHRVRPRPRLRPRRLQAGAGNLSFHPDRSGLATLPAALRGRAR